MRPASRRARASSSSCEAASIANWLFENGVCRPDHSEVQDAERQARAAARALRGTSCDVHCDQRAYARVPAGVVEGDGTPHRVSDEPNGWIPEVLDQGLEVFRQGARPGFSWVVGVSVPAEVEGDHVKALGHRRGDMVPPVRVGAAAVEQHQFLVFGIAPVKRVQANARQRRGAEVLVPGRHAETTLAPIPASDAGKVPDP